MSRSSDLAKPYSADGGEPPHVHVERERSSAKFRIHPVVRLTEQGITFRHLLEEARRELARHYLLHSSRQLNEIAYLLGYNDANAFFRAFHQWEGISPAKWRVLQKSSQPTAQAHVSAACRATEGFNGCMKTKNLLQIIPASMISAAMATTTLAAGKISPEAVSKGILTALNNQVSLSADQQEKAKPIIDKHVADLEAVKNDTTLDKAAKKAKVVELRQQCVTDINGILTPDQQKKWEASREANKAKVKARVKQKAVEKSPSVEAESVIHPVWAKHTAEKSLGALA